MKFIKRSPVSVQFHFKVDDPTIRRGRIAKLQKKYTNFCIMLL